MQSAILTSISPCFQRHILTAAHCVCGKRDVHGSDATLCIDRDVSQIQDDPSNNKLNRLTIYGGRKNQSDANWNNRGELGHYRWQVSHAYIMQNPHLPDTDIGIASIAESLPENLKLFDQGALLLDFRSRRRNQIKTSRIIPICLAKEKSDLSGKTLKGAAWGLEYEELRENNPRNPEYSSCMTSELSLREYRFQNCDMQKIKANDWECRTDQAPNGYPVAECEDYFNEALWADYKIKQRFAISQKKLDKLYRRDIMYVKNSTTDDPITCIRVTGELEPNWRNWRHGWCELPGSTSTNFKWGICSPSCSIQLMKVIL